MRARVNRVHWRAAAGDCFDCLDWVLVLSLFFLGSFGEFPGVPGWTLLARFGIILAAWNSGQPLGVIAERTDLIDQPGKQFYLKSFPNSG